MNKDILEKARKDYIHSGGSLGGGRWEDISARLPSQSFSYRMIVGRVIVISIIPILFLSGLVGVSQASKPGEFLYPVKVASQKFANKISNKLEFNIQKKSQKVLSGQDKVIEKNQEETGETENKKPEPERGKSEENKGRGKN